MLKLHVMLQHRYKGESPALGHLDGQPHGRETANEGPGLGEDEFSIR
jgi:hypothetical protein